MLQLPAEGTSYFAVYAWSGYPSITITGTYVLDTGEPPPPTGNITTTADVKGNGKFVQVHWDGATSSTVDIHHTSNGSVSIFNTANDGSYKDNSGSALDIYKVCEAGLTSACSDPVTAN